MRQTRESGRLLAVGRRQILIKRKQLLECIRLGGAVVIEQPYPIIVLLKRETEAAIHAAAGPEIFGVAQHGCISYQWSLERIIAGGIVHQQDPVDWSGLQNYSFYRPIDNVGIVE